MLNTSDFRIRASSFDFRNPMNTLRIVAGAGLIPHALSKFTGGGINPDTLGFFAAAGFTPAAFWLVVAALSEFVVGVALVLGIATRWSALAGAAILMLALGSLVKVVGFNWFWNASGVEYLVFWIIACLLVAQYAFKEHHR